jgi:lysophospholipase L1-like esterase
MSAALATACGSASSGSGSTQDGNPGSHVNPSSSSGGGTGSGGGASSGATDVGSSGSETGSSGGGSGSGSSGGAGQSSGTGIMTGSDSGTDSGTAAAACVKGDTKASEVIMLGDSYLDPLNGNVGPVLVTDSMQSWTRLYYHSGAAMANGSGTLNVPWQYDGMPASIGTYALGDTAVSMPKDVKVVIMDGGGNDVLIDQRSCLTMVDATCTAAIDKSVARGKSLMQEMASNGVKHIVFFYYPHLDPAGGGLLPTPAPTVNDADDYALPRVEENCCGASFTSSASDYSCRGNGPGTDCILIDTIPAFSGHATDYIQSDHVHPNATGAKVIADLIWNTMVKDCIAQP